MNELTPLPSLHRPTWRRRVVCAIGSAIVTTGALAQPAQRPLLVGSTGVPPNILVSLDNSSSMADAHDDGYQTIWDGVRANDISRWNGTDQASNPQHFWSQRSAEINLMYYNPRVTYLPRVDDKNVPLAPTDGIVFISNALSAKHKQVTYAKSVADVANGGPTVVIDDNFPDLPLATPPAGWTVLVSISSNFRTPINQPHGSSGLHASTPAFTYVICKTVGIVYNNSTPVPTCTVPERIVDVRHDATSPIELPAGHRRTDCDTRTTPAFCTPRQEIANIINWYRYYGTRIKATQTALGQAFHSDKLKDGLARIGYRPLGLKTPSGVPMPLLGHDASKPHSLRGVRSWKRNTPEHKQFYDWLYGTYLQVGTPLLKAYAEVGNYYAIKPGSVENPWAKNPAAVANAGNPEMSCRRSYHLMLSDGGWSDTAIPTGYAREKDNTAGPSFTRGELSNAPDATFAYDPRGSTTRPLSYVPYPSSARDTLSDIAAQLYWHTDLRPDLPNNIPVRSGDPTFWQNVKTYAIGYMIRPMGEVDKPEHRATGLTFAQIRRYRAEFLRHGYELATKPRWPANGADFLSFLPPSGSTITREDYRVDDFIHSGYTGGGRSFSVQNAEGIRSAVDTILSEILDASGNDAGIALTSSEDDASALGNRLKFKVEYQTSDNAGNVIAEKLDNAGDSIELDTDAAGKTLSPKSKTYWSAKALLPAHTARRVYAMGNAGGFEFTGRLDKLPAPVRSALSTGPQTATLPDDERFVDYLRGKELVFDTLDQPYRLRSSRMGAIVNSRPLLLDVAPHMGYHVAGRTVSGASQYAEYRERMAKEPQALMVATNAGAVHALDAANGQEFAAYMPRRSMRRLLDQATEGSEFRYVLDGPMNAIDVHDGSGWNQLVVGTGGRGERVVYGLRARYNATGHHQFAASDFLWEAGPDTIDTANDGDATPFTSGHMSNPARGGQTDSGHWVVVVNSGHYNGTSDGQQHGLVVLDAGTGAVLRTIALPPAHPAGRGLGGVTLVRDARSRIVAAYAGDARGQLWRFDLRGAPSNWKVSYGKPLFNAAHGRPIYAAPAWAPHPKGGAVVVVGTGMLLEDGDVTDTGSPESVYGIWDPTSRANGAEAPDFQTVDPDGLLEQGVVGLHSTVGTNDFYTGTRNRIDWTKHKGWKMALGLGDRGERVIEQITNLGSSVSINSVVINRNEGAETCTSEGAAAVKKYVLNTLDGVAKPAFDIDNDGKLDPVFMVHIKLGGFARGDVTVLTAGADQQTVSAPQTPYFDGGAGEPSDSDDNKCVASRFKSVGTNDGFVAGGVDCAGGWSRQQYQLTSLPQ